MEIEQTIGDNFSGTKNITVSTGGGSDLEAGIEFIYDMREHMTICAVCRAERRSLCR